MATFIIGTLVFTGIGFAAYSTYKSKKKGGGCGCGCAGCENSKNCH